MQLLIIKSNCTNFHNDCRLTMKRTCLPQTLKKCQKGEEQNYLFSFKIQFVDKYNYLLVHTLQYSIPALQNFLTLCWRNRRTRQALKSSSSSDHPPITGIYSYFPIGKVAIFADPSHMVAHCAPVRMG